MRLTLKSMTTKNKAPFAITTGDSNGIGLEVTAKALVFLQKKKLLKSSYLLFRKSEAQLSSKEKRIQKIYFSYLDRFFRRTPVRSQEISSPSWLSETSHTSSRKPLLYDFASEEEAPYWVEVAANGCLNKSFSGLVTAPLSKTLINSCGLKDVGHTDILKRVSGSKNVYMTFLGKDFHVVLLTGHIPLSKVSKHVHQKSLLQLMKTLEEFFPLKTKSKKIGLLGLNPHAGDCGLIGHEEVSWMNSFVSKHSHVLAGPLPPDSAFTKKNWKKYSLFISLYHDQGLIPFKLHHGQNGAHFSMGLPFIRTSVDHGTAFDLYGKNKADPESMIQALLWAEKMARSVMTS